MPTTRNVLMIVENAAAPEDGRVWPEAMALCEAGFQISIICPKGAKPFDQTYSLISGIHIYRYRLPSGTGTLMYLTEYLIALIMTFRLSLLIWRKHGLDVIHTSNPPDVFFLIARFYRLFGKRFIYDQHDPAPEMFRAIFAERAHGRVGKLIGRLLMYCERHSYRAADLVIVTNESLRQIAMKRGGCPAGKVAVVRNGPDPRQFSPGRGDPAFRADRRFQVIFIGVMGIQDGVQYALQAMDVLVHQRGRQDISLVLAGDGPYCQTLQAQTRELDLCDFVSFIGLQSREEVVQYLRASDVGIVPDPQNEMNEVCTTIKTMEYMAVGLPIVSFDLHETRFSAEEAALYATPNDVSEFATRIEDLLADDELRHSMGAQGRKRIEDGLSWDYSKKQLWRAYSHMLGRSLTLPSPVLVGEVVSSRRYSDDSPMTLYP